MSKKQFLNDADWSTGMSNAFFYPLYRELAYEGRFVTVVNSEYSKFSRKLQSREIDVMMQYQIEDVISIGVEEKIQRKHWPSLFIETDSCTVSGYESVGWIETLEADYLLYGLGILEPTYAKHVNDAVASDYIAIDAYWIQFPPFQRWFQDNLSLFGEQWTSQHNRSSGRIVPVLYMPKYPLAPWLAESGVPVKRYLCERDRCLPVPLETKLNAMRIKTSQLRRNLDKTLDNIYQMKKLQGFEEDGNE